MKSKNLFIVLFLSGFIAGLVLFGRASVQKTEATFTPKAYVCHCESNECQTLHIAVPAAIAHVLQHDDDYYGKCKEVEVTPTLTPTPTVEVTPTPEVTPEVTPTPGQGGGNPPTFAGSSTEAPACGDAKPSRVANINVKTTGNKGELEVQWALPSSDKVHIEYGLEKYAQHALLNTPNDGNEVIRDLTSNEHYWFRVLGVNGCAVGEPSEWFDPLVP